MEEACIWNLSIFEKSYSNIDEIIDAITSGEVTSFRLREKYTPGDPIYNYLECKFEEKNKVLRYTDDVHSLVTMKYGFYPSVMNPDFFIKHRDVIIKALLEKIKKGDRKYYTITDYLYSDELLDFLLTLDDVCITFVNVDLSENAIKKIKDKHIDAFIETNGNRKQLSSRYVIGFYTLKQLEEKKKQNDNIYLCLTEIEKVELDNFKLIDESCVIKISSFNPTEDEYKTICQFIENIDTLGKNYIVKVDVKKRNVFDKIFNNKKFNNVKLVIYNDLYEYSYEEYQEEEKKLDALLSQIKDKDFSPLEKYLAVYNIVKNYKKYKENPDQKEESRYLRHILDNEYMVCVGYAKLLEVLCEKMGISVAQADAVVDISYDDGFTLEEKKVEGAGHARCLVSMDDDKYGVHGIYIADPTWDNELGENRLNNALMTFDKMQVAKRMFFYSQAFPILDVHNFKEYNDQVNFLLKREMDRSIHHNKAYQEKLLSSYANISIFIVSAFECDPKYDYFHDKSKECKKVEDYEQFFTEFGNYIITRVNKKVSDEVILNAASHTDIVLGKDNDYIANTRKKYYELEDVAFPYKIDKENAHNLIRK